MKKGIYIAIESEGMSLGVKKKIRNQIQALSKLFDIKYVGIRKKKVGTIKAIMSRMPLGSAEREYNIALEDIAKEGLVDFFYFRGYALDRKYLWFISEIKKGNPQCRIVFEIPTYSNGLELLKNKTMWPWFFKGLFYRRNLRKYVDRIATYSEDEYIYGIQTIKIQNGINLSVFHKPEGSENNINGKEKNIELVAVASFQKAHGYDRVIRGLREYYRDMTGPKVFLNLVGDGSELPVYRKLATKYGLSEYIKFHGRKDGEELENIYKEMDIGMGTFASYKRGVFLSSSLKVREYLAHGLPIVSGMREDVFDEDCRYGLIYPNDNSTIDIKRIVNFYNSLMENRTATELKESVWEFAKQKVDINLTMLPIIEFILD